MLNNMIQNPNGFVGFISRNQSTLKSKQNGIGNN